MQSPSQQSSTCPNCSGELNATPVGGLGCMTYLLRAGTGSEEETVHDSTEFKVLDDLFVDAKIDHYSQVQKLPPDKTEARSSINMPYKDA
jgi:hypothetical protein